jgi:hypothetical protein
MTESNIDRVGRTYLSGSTYYPVQTTEVRVIEVEVLPELRVMVNLEVTTEVKVVLSIYYSWTPRQEALI